MIGRELVTWMNNEPGSGQCIQGASFNWQKVVVHFTSSEAHDTHGHELREILQKDSNLDH